MSWAIAFEPIVEWKWALALLVPALILIVVGLVLRHRGGWLRLVALALLALALANPVFMDEEREQLKSVVALIVDRSQSQDIGTRTELTDRTVAQLREDLSGFNEFELRVVEAGQASATEERTSTHLFGPLENSLRDVPPSRIAGAIMVTDGQVHDRPSTQAQGNAPLHILVTGEEDEFDRRIQFERAPRFGIINRPLDFSYRVTSTDGQTGTAQVQIRINGELVRTEQAVIGAETTLELAVPMAGKNIIELAIEQLPGELTDVNNRTIAIVDGIRENLRVLLVSGEPHAGERTWRNLLKSDASVDLVHFTILRPPEKQDGTPIHELSLIAFPTRELFVERINDFDLIIFDRYQHRDVLPLLYYDYIAQYVEQGGALLVAAGPEYASYQSIARTPLMPVLPAIPTGNVLEQGFLPQLTEMGQRHPVTRALEGADITPPQWSRWFRQIEIQRTSGEIVMQGADDKPLLVLERKGEGRVALLLSDQGWLWARGFEGGGPYAALYRRMAHWLMKESELEEERLLASGRGMMLDITRQTMSDDPGPAMVTTPSGQSVEVPMRQSQPGLFTGSMETSEIGLYQIANGELSALAHIGPVNAPEFQNPVSTTEALRPVAEATGGSVQRISQTLTGNVDLPRIAAVRANNNTAGRGWLGLRTTNDSILKSVHRVPLFAGLLGLAVLLGALGSMWYREGR